VLVQTGLVPGCLVGVHNALGYGTVDGWNRGLVGLFGSILVTGLDGAKDLLDSSAHMRAQRSIMLAMPFGLTGPLAGRNAVGHKLLLKNRVKKHQAEHYRMNSNSSQEK
jgi:hypothetical protein